MLFASVAVSGNAFLLEILGEGGAVGGVGEGDGQDLPRVELLVLR